MTIPFRTMTVMLAVSGVLFMGCDEDEGGGSWGQADETTSDAGSPDVTTTDAGSDDIVVTDSGAPAVDFAAVAAALDASCGGCHGGAAGCSISTSCFIDDEAVLTKPPGNAFACQDTASIAECSIFRIDNGTMPPSGIPPAAEDLAVLESYVGAM